MKDLGAYNFFRFLSCIFAPIGIKPQLSLPTRTARMYRIRAKNVLLQIRRLLATVLVSRVLVEGYL